LAICETLGVNVTPAPYKPERGFERGPKKCETLIIVCHTKPEFKGETMREAIRDIKEVSPRGVLRRVYRQNMTPDSNVTVKMCVDDTLRNGGIAQAVMDYAWSQIAREFNHEQRTDAIASVHDDISGVVTTIRKNTATLFEFPLPGGVMLGEANIKDLNLAIQEYARQSRGMLSCSIWLKEVRKKITGNKKVKNAMTLEDVGRLRIKAEKDSAKIVG